MDAVTGSPNSVPERGAWHFREATPSLGGTTGAAAQARRQRQGVGRAGLRARRKGANKATAHDDPSDEACRDTTAHGSHRTPKTMATVVRIIPYGTRGQDSRSPVNLGRYFAS